MQIIAQGYANYDNGGTQIGKSIAQGYAKSFKGMQQGYADKKF